ncbi:MAG: murein L,D-transpeptidase, partial [Sphingomonas sp.]
MRFGLIGSSLLAVSMVLSACSTESGGSGQTNAGAEQQQSGWTEATAKQLRDAIGKRAEHGLDRLPLDKGIDSLDQAALSKAALTYGEALAHGATDPTKLFEVYTLPRPDPDLKPGLARALKDGKVGDWLESLAPRDDGYRKLSQTYLSLRG